jgi:type IV pilus assembly protein PilC
LLDDENGSYKKQLKNYLTYPIATLIAAFIVSAILLIFVVPVFDEVFQSFGGELPTFTRYIVNLSEFMQTSWWICIGIILFGKYCFMHPINKPMRSKLALYFSVVVYAETSATIRTLHLLLSYGFNLQEALRLSATASQNIMIIQTLIKSADALAEKKSFVDSLKQQGIFPNKVLQSLRVFEKTNRLILLDRLVNRMSFNIKSNIKESAKKMNSVIMVILGLIVGTLIIAMYLPIFSMGAAVG